jgi:tryptophan synthase alpha subunit
MFSFVPLASAVADGKTIRRGQDRVFKANRAHRRLRQV